MVAEFSVFLLFPDELSGGGMDLPSHLIDEARKGFGILLDLWWPVGERDTEMYIA